MLSSVHDSSKCKKLKKKKNKQSFWPKHDKANW